MALNLSKLFDRPAQPSFLRNINPEPEDAIALKAAKADIQRHLKAAIPKWLETQLGEKPEHLPRFRTQGSWAYRTCNDPCQTPPQEMDWDLGIYLPVSLWEDNKVHPKAAAKGYYEMVRELMAPLAREKKWTLAEKPTCVRVLLGNGTRAHVDLPLYAAPDSEFVQIKEAIAKASMAMDCVSFAEAQRTWASLTRIALARKDGTWDPSDPGRVVVWFDKKIERHGEQLRRVCRYLKAWRDHIWPSGGPSSIVLMVCAAQTLDRAQADFAGRDDLALRHVLTALPGQMLAAIKEPMIDPDEDLNRLAADERVEASRRAGQFLAAMNDALGQNFDNRHQALALVRGQLGDRFPSDGSGITPDDGPTNIRTVPAEPRARAVIVPTKAG
jgi:hypothetical protein